MKKLILTTLFLIAIVLQSNAQDLLKEISRTFDNGQPMFIDYLETDNLKKVKTELYNEQGDIIFSMQFNPDSGLPDGEFYDLINKGSFSNGVLNCKNCMLVEANTPSVYTYNYNKQNTLITKGDVINGRLVGEVKRYAISEDTYRKVDWESTRKYVAAGANIGFRDVKTYRTGNFKETLIDTKTYNENGVLDGIVYIDYTDGKRQNKVRLRGKLNVKNGVIKSLVSYDSNGLQRDSLSNEQKIWKIDYKYVKNDGFLVFENPNSNNFSGDYTIVKNSPLILIGGEQDVDHYFRPKVYRSDLESNSNRFFDTGGVKTALDNNGLFTGYLNTGRNYINKIETHPIQNNIGLHKGVYVGSRINIMSRIYNYIINDYMDDKIGSSYEFGGDVRTFYAELKQSYEDNYFKKHLKSISLNENLLFDFDLKKINNNIISLSDYLSTLVEIMKNDFHEIQEIRVLNKKTLLYDKVNFEELIQLAEQKEEKAKAEAEEQARIKLEKEKKAKAEAEEQARIKLEKEKKAKAEAERKAKEEVQNTIRSLEPWYSSERKSSGKFLKQIKESKETLIKSMNIDLLEITIYRIPGVDDPKKTYTAYTFGNLRDLDFFKQQAEVLDDIKLFYEDLNNMTLYFNK